MSDIPVLNGVRGPEPVGYVPQRKQVLVITNDSTVFLTDRWVSAYEMFGGRVTEVKNLVERLSEHAQVSFGIISGQYGFVPANYVVMRYPNVPSCREEYQEAQDRTDYAGKIAFLTRGFFDRIVVCVPKDMFAIIRDSLPDGRVIAVTSPEFEDYCVGRGWTFLPRSGARVGSANADRIEGIVRSL